MRKRSTNGRIAFQNFQSEVAKYENKGLNLDEIMEVKEAFDFIDADETGSISKKEFVTAKKMMKMGETEEENKGIFEEMLSLMDTDKSGSINFQEFIGVFTNQKDMNQSKDKYYADLFFLFAGETGDKDKLSFKDLENIVDKIEEDIETDELREMFDRADEDKDGFVGVKEFVKFMVTA